MSTCSCIARQTGEGTFEGVYHHWDGYPTGLGKTLYTLYHGHFKQDLKAMLEYLIDQHPAGYSTINGADFKLPAGYGDSVRYELVNGKPDYTKPIPHGPVCFCHGKRNEEAQPVTESNDLGMEWAYVFDEEKREMYVLERVYTDNATSTQGKNLANHHMVGMFGGGAPGQQRWVCAATVELDKPAPNWDKISVSDGSALAM